MQDGHDRSGSQGIMADVCPICLDAPDGPVTQTPCCKEQFCTECFAQYLKLRIAEKRVERLVCPNVDCAVLLPDDEVRRLVDEATFQQMLRFRQELLVERDKDQTWCPQPDCRTACARPADETREPASCPTCKHAFCWACKAAWHEGQTCEAARAARGDVVLDLAGMADELEFKNCPSCDAPVQRDEGCAQMRCANCFAIWCWHCRERVDADIWASHWTSGACAGKLGHSTMQIVSFRAQIVCTIFCFICVILPLALVLGLLSIPCWCCCGERMAKFFEENVAPHLQPEQPLQARAAQRERERHLLGEP